MDTRDQKEKISQGWLHVNLIIEVLGKPADYIEKVTDMAVDKLGEEKGVNLLGKKLHPAKLVAGSKEAFTTFAEAELLVDNMATLVGLIFDYMPASIEIVEPQNISFKLEDANALLNDLATRLHQYDLMAKQTRLERELLIKKIEEARKKKQGQEQNKEQKERTEKTA